MVSFFICKMNIFPIFNTDLFSYPLLCSSAPASQYWKIFVVLGSFQVPQVQLAHASLASDGSGHIWAEPPGRCELLTSAVWATSCLHYLCDAWANLHVQLACQVEHVRSLLVTTSDYCFLANDTIFFFPISHFGAGVLLFTFSHDEFTPHSIIDTSVSPGSWEQKRSKTCCWMNGCCSLLW